MVEETDQAEPPAGDLGDREVAGDDRPAERAADLGGGVHRAEVRARDEDRVRGGALHLTDDGVVHLAGGQPGDGGADMKSFRGPLGIYLKLVWLQAESGTGGGDVAGNADYPPTKAELEVFELLSTQLAEARKDFEDLYARAIPAFNEAARGKGLVQLMTVAEPDEPRPPARPEQEDDEDEDSAD